MGGLPEVVVDGETGILVDGEDDDGVAQSMAKALATLLTQPDRARVLGAARLRAQQTFDGTKLVEGYEALYARLVEEAAMQR